MRVEESRVFRGPSPYGYRPLIRLTVDLEELEDWPTDRLPGFVDGLLAHLPTLEEHTCGYGTRGGFVRRLREGTWLGHVLEHVAIELQCLAGTPVTYGKARGVRGRPGVYHVVYDYDEEAVGLRAGELALELVRSLLPPDLPSARREPLDFAAEKDALALLAGDLALGPSTRALVDEARRRDIPVIRLDDQGLVQLGYGCRQRRIQATVTSHTAHIGVEIAQDKLLTCRLLREAGLPATEGVRVSDEDEAVRAAERVGYPVVVKPVRLSQGRAVALDLRDAEQVRAAFRACWERTDRVLVENFYPGRDYRVLVVDGRVVAVSERVPAHVVGDGVRTVRALVDEVNRDPRRGVGHERLLTRIEVDEEVERVLARAGRTLDTVPGAGEHVALRGTANLSTGGTAIDRTDRIHPDNAEIARRAARIVGLDVAGVDIVTEDIGRSLREHPGGIVEVNAAPGFRMHIAPTEGTPRDVARPVLDMLFPPGAPTRVPVAAITGTNGKTTTSRMVAHILQMAGKHVGLTTTDGVWIDGEPILAGDLTGPFGARVVLRDPHVEAAVLETARGGILREGLGFRRCDVGAVLNVSGDHLGLRGVETLEDLAFVKRLVLEVVCEHGVSVMNADDPLVVAMAPHAEGRHAWFSLDPANPIVRAAVEKGDAAAVWEPSEDAIVLLRGGQRILVLPTVAVPATFGGRARFNVENALAAVLIAHGLGTRLEHIRQGLATFETTPQLAPGRANLHDVGGVRVLVDYAHNPAAMRAVAELAARMGGRRIAVVGAAGDRRDEDIRDLGEAAGAGFDHLVLREDVDRRGRAPGEAARLLREGALRAGRDAGAIDIVLDEGAAVDRALAWSQPGDLVLVCADDVAAVTKRVARARVHAPA